MAIMVEFSNLDYSRQAHQTISAIHPDLELSIIEDLRQLLYRFKSPAPHIQRHHELHQKMNQRYDLNAHQQMQLTDIDLTY